MELVCVNCMCVCVCELMLFTRPWRMRIVTSYREFGVRTTTLLWTTDVFCFPIIIIINCCTLLWAFVYFKSIRHTLLNYSSCSLENPVCIHLLLTCFDIVCGPQVSRYFGKLLSQFLLWAGSPISTVFILCSLWYKKHIFCNANIKNKTKSRK